jgi:DNA-binding NtrC family response regulator
MPLRSPKPGENDGAESSVLLISPYPEDETLLRNVVNGFSFRLEVSLDWRTARTGSPLSSFPVIITERDLPDASWENVFSNCEGMQNLPRLIVTSRLADERLWAEVLNRRGFDVLAKPFDRDEVTRVLGHALCRSSPAPTRKLAASGHTAMSSSSKSVRADGVQRCAASHPLRNRLETKTLGKQLASTRIICTALRHLHPKIPSST